MNKFLYGAAVQGIQSFIFQTNKLQEIVGASELVEEICTAFFQNQVGDNFKKDNLILGAAGNIKYIFEDYDSCQDLVRKFPKAVMEMAPGITISQAVVEYEQGKLNDALQVLEDKLRVQRNKVPLPFEIGFMGTERSRRTGDVAYKPLPNENELIDEATFLKIEARKGRNKLFEDISGKKIDEYKQNELLYDLDELSGSWLAVVHADGNGVGSIIQNLNKSFSGRDDKLVNNAFKKFSEALDTSTKNAAKIAFDEIIKKKDKGIYPIRPIILGGDDLTLIIRVDLALDFTIKYLEEFENQSKEELRFLKTEFEINGFENGITACAGIAYVKKSYPFHYAVDLADKLCKDAKNFVKGKGDYQAEGTHPLMTGLIPKSALAFYKVQDSFIEGSLQDMKNRTLTSVNIDFRYGPYLIRNGEPKDKNDQCAHISELKNKLKVVGNFENGEEEYNGISKLRRWIIEIYKDKSMADFMLDRMKEVNGVFYKEMKMDEERKKVKSIIYDIVQLDSLKN